MADILIRGMELPKSGGILCINIFPEGKVTRQLDLSCEQIATAVPLPEGHGRLGDLDKLVANFREAAEECKRLADAVESDPLTEVNNKAIYAAIIEAILRTEAAPTIVPAEGGGEDG